MKYRAIETAYDYNDDTNELVERQVLVQGGCDCCTTKLDPTPELCDVAIADAQEFINQLVDLKEKLLREEGKKGEQV